MRNLLAAVVAVGVLAGACSSSSQNSAPDRAGAAREAIAAEVASYDLAAGDTERFIVGLFTSHNRFVDFGHVRMEFSYLGTKSSGVNPKAPVKMSSRGSFIPVGSHLSPAPDRPTALPASKGRGVYGTNVRFDRPGYWQVRVTADVAGLGRQQATAAFQVYRHHQVPAPGQPAPRTRNLTLRSHVPRAAIDSRAEGSGRIPDPELHRTTIAASIAHHEPALVVFSTPVYCISRFCGPTTNLVARLAKRFHDRANFIHVEIWRNYTHHVINKAAADWLYRHGDLREPWVFLIGADGRIVARWANAVDAAEIVPYLKKLPPMHARSHH